MIVRHPFNPSMQTGPGPAKMPHNALHSIEQHEADKIKNKIDDREQQQAKKTSRENTVDNIADGVKRFHNNQETSKADPNQRLVYTGEGGYYNEGSNEGGPGSSMVGGKVDQVYGKDGNPIAFGNGQLKHTAKTDLVGPTYNNL